MSVRLSRTTDSRSRTILRRDRPRSGLGCDEYCTLEFQVSVSGWVRRLERLERSIGRYLMRAAVEDVPMVGGSTSFTCIGSCCSGVVFPPRSFRSLVIWSFPNSEGERVFDSPFSFSRSICILA